MRRPLALLSLACLSLASLGLGSLGVVACGGADKPPLTPDSVDVPTDGPEAGAPSAPVAPAPSVKK
jgi:hypothetical protein